MSTCEALGYNRMGCMTTNSKIAYSKGAWIQRPAALCLSLGSCRPTCTSRKGAALNQCTQSGWDDGSFSTVVEDPCDSCAVNEYCDHSSDGARTDCRCDPLTGFDKCVILGTCLDECLRLNDLIVEYNSLAFACTTNADCDVNFHCDTTEPSRKMDCENGELIIVKTKGTCVPQSRTLLEAKFANNGKSIMVIHSSITFDLKWNLGHAELSCGSG